MTPEQIAAIAKGLTEAQRRALLWLSDEPQTWPKGSEAPLYALSKVMKGDPTKQVATLAVLCKDVGRSPPMPGKIWGKTFWVATPLGLAVRAYLMERGA